MTSSSQPGEPACAGDDTRIPDSEALYRRLSRDNPDHYAAGMTTGQRRPASAAFKPKPQEDGLSACRRPKLAEAGLDAVLEAAGHRTAGRRGLHAPPLEADPLALALGLVPGPGRRLSGPRLKTARMKRHLRTSQLADLLAARGWDVSTKDVFRWELAGSAEVAPALLAAIAEVLRVPAEELTAAAGAHDPAAAEIQAAAATPTPGARPQARLPVRP